MFKFLQRAQAPTILADCEKELHRTAKAEPYFMSDRDVNSRAGLLQRAAAAGLGEHETVKRLDFLQRLLGAVTVDPTPAPAVLDALLAEAKRYQFENISAVRSIRQHQELHRLKQDGPHVVRDHDPQGRAIYFQCAAAFKNKDGRFAIRADGVTFTGKVVIEIAWSNVVHAAKTTHTYQGVDHNAVALQEGKRRTPTLFAFTRDSEAAYACEVTMRLWEQSKKAATPGHPMTAPEPLVVARDDTAADAVIPRQPKGRSHSRMAVVGESFHQDALQRLLAGRGRTCVAALVPEPTNPYDANAVKVVVDGSDVGHLARDVAKTFGPLLRQQPQPITVPAELHGGEDDKPSIGVVLDFAAVYALQASGELSK